MEQISKLVRNNRVLLIYTGGTIGMGINPKTKALEPLDFNHLLQNIPEIKLLSTQIDVYQFAQPIDSSDMTPAFWVQLVNIIAARYAQYDGFIILHGTDTMAYTASALSFMLENLTKPVTLIIAPWCPRCAFISTADCCAATVRRNRMPMVSMRSTRLTIPIWARRALRSSFHLIIY